MPLSSFVGGRIFGVRRGSEKPWILAMHGWQRSHRDFDGILEGSDSIAIDLPGFGASPTPPEAWTTAQYAEAVAPILDEMADRVVVIGHSFGGRVAVHLAAAHPDRVAAQVLTGVPLTRPPGPRPKPPRGMAVGRRLHKARIISDQRMEQLRQKHGSADYRNAEGVLRPILVKAVNEDYLQPLGSFPNPVELVWGQLDTAAPVVAAEKAAAVCAKGHLEVLPDVDHFTPLRAPEALREALARCRPGSQATESQRA